MVVKFDLSKDPIIEANPTSYEDFRVLMARLRINMDASKPVTTNEYKYWRAKIKELRVMAIERNIDAYTLEVDTHYTIRVAEAEPKIKKLEEERNAAFDKIQAALGQPNYEAVKKEQEAIMTAKEDEIRKIQNGLYDGVSEEEKLFFHNMVKEAYIVKELLDIRHQRDTATTEQERDVLRARAEKLRLEANAVLEAAGQNTEFQRDDFEGRVLYLFHGRTIAPPRFGEADTRSEEDKKIWETYKELMDGAYKKYKTYSDTEKKDLVPEEELWEQIRVKEKEAKEGIWKDRKYETFSGTDMVVYFAFPGYKPIDIGLASLISYSLYREKKQIRTIGAINTRGITKGPRTISGRLVMTVVREHFVEAIKREIPYMRTIKNMLMDELPPFDILVSFGNEYGAAASLVIHGVTFVDEQKTLTIEDLYTENIFTFLARDIDVMKTVFAKYTDEYDPMMWMSNSFIPDGSEILGDFYPKDLELTQAAGLLEDPEPFYGEISGWNASLYDLMYTGVDSGSLTIDSSGNLVDSNSSSSSGGSSGGDKDKDTPTSPETEPAKPSEGNTKKHSATHRLWLTKDSEKKAKERGILYGGYSSNLWDAASVKVGKNTAKERAWKLMETELGHTSKSHDAFRKRMLAHKDSKTFKGSKSKLDFTLCVYDSELTVTKVTGYKIMVTFEYFPVRAYKKGEIFYKNLTDKKGKHIKNRERHIAVLGCWKTSVPWSDISLAMKAKKSGTASNEKHWINTVNATKEKHGVNVKNWKVGEINKDQKESFLSGKLVNSNGSAYIMVPNAQHEFNIDLHKIFFMPSTINQTGERQLLSFNDLPEGARIVFKFTYVPNTPSNPKNKDGDLRFFYMVVKKGADSDSYDVLKHNAFFREMDTQNTKHLTRWELFNAKDYKK